MTTSSHAVQCLPSVIAGWSFTTVMVTSAISSAIAAALAWYIKGRGMTGVKIDLNNVKTDVENLKAKIGANAVV